MARKEISDKTVDLVSALAWPFIALIGLVLFTGPIKSLLHAGNVESVKIGSLELNLRASDLPQVADSELASALMGLTSEALVPLLATEPDRPQQVCQMGSDQYEFNERTRRPFNVLSDRGLMIVEEEHYEDEQGAVSDACLTPVLTDLGIRARTLIIDLMSAQLKTAKVR